MLSALDFWLGKISDTLKTENTLIIITSDHGSTAADFTDKMFKFNLENDQLRDNKKITESKNLLRFDVMKSYNEKQNISYKIGHKFFTSLPDSLQVFRKKSADAYIKKRKKTIKKNLLTRLNKIEKLNPTPYQKRLLQKSVIYPNDCYDENFRPALIFSGYNIPPKKTINSQISSIDIFPTILEIIEIDTQMNSHGRSVLPLINNENSEENPAFLDNAAISSEIEYGDTVGVRTSNFKYFRDRINPEKDVHLFNLINDPLELSNISKENSDIVEKLEKNLLQINPTGNFSFEQTNELNKDDTEKAKDILRDLGYIK
jgi:arylsulfatase A-like enzyme